MASGLHRRACVPRRIRGVEGLGTGGRDVGLRACVRSDRHRRASEVPSQGVRASPVCRAGERYPVIPSAARDLAGMVSDREFFVYHDAERTLPRRQQSSQHRHGTFWPGSPPGRYRCSSPRRIIEASQPTRAWPLLVSASCNRDGARWRESYDSHRNGIESNVGSTLPADCAIARSPGSRTHPVADASRPTDTDWLWHSIEGGKRPRIVRSLATLGTTIGARAGSREPGPSSRGEKRSRDLVVSSKQAGFVVYPAGPSRCR